MSEGLISKARVANPCPMKWSKMKGNDRVRFCAKCELNVYNLSALSAEEGEALLQAHEGKRLCGAFYTRADGTIETADCLAADAHTPKGRFAALALACIVLVATGCKPHREDRTVTLDRLRESNTLRPLIDRLDPRMVAGAIFVSAPSMTPSGSTHP